MERVTDVEDGQSRRWSVSEVHKVGGRMTGRRLDLATLVNRELIARIKEILWTNSSPTEPTSEIATVGRVSVT